ncbi:hypothetical protein O181_010494 [Austropuccinia psidii MF-1]|uniref:Uncharacterized protein n=1 Tax=Austropuccinia psidii MF-1 TaxID=1389203 RepID=A0A9Q3BSQ8_9BASI|nr:hypothetical protein [Austropuccinia psidii MF-1]
MYAACNQGLGASLHQRQIVDGEPRKGVICYICRKLKDSEGRYGENQTESLCITHLETANVQEYRGNIKIIYKEGKSHTNAEGLNRWPLDTEKSNPAYDPEVAAKIPIHFMEIDRRKNLQLSKSVAKSGTSDSDNTEPEGTKTSILGISSSQLSNGLFSSVTKPYDKHKQFSILLQIIQQKYRTPEL